jgi:hypothetical protein
MCHGLPQGMCDANNGGAGDDAAMDLRPQFQQGKLFDKLISPIKLFYFMQVQKAATQTRRISNGRSHELGEGEEDDDFELLHNQVLLIIVPLALLLILCLIILMRRCCFSSSVSDNI